MPRSGDRLSPCSCLRPLRMDTLIVVAEFLARVGLGQIPVRPRTVLSGGEELHAGIGQVTQDILDLLGMEDQARAGVTTLLGALQQVRDRRMLVDEVELPRPLMRQVEKDVAVLRARDRDGFHAEVARCTDFGIRLEERLGRHPGAGQRYREEVDIAMLLRDQDATMHLPVVALEGDERSEEHTSELQSLMRISYAVFCLKKKN